MAKLKSRALLSSFAATAVIAGIGGLATQAHAGYVQVQCASQGTAVGDVDNISGNIATSPVKVVFSSSSIQLFQYSQSYGNAPGIVPMSSFSNTLTLTSNTTSAAAYSCSTAYLDLHLTGLNPSATGVTASIQTTYGTLTDANSATSSVINGAANLALSITGIADAASLATLETDVVNVTVNNDINQVLLPETVKLTAYVSSDPNPTMATNSCSYKRL